MAARRPPRDFGAWRSPRCREFGPRGPSGRDLREGGDDLLAVGVQVLLLAFGHEVDVELVDPDRFQLAQLRGHLLGVADDREAFGDLVGHELTVLRALATVLLVVVELPRLDEVGERLGDLRIPAIALDQVHDVVRDHRGEPPDLFARRLEVVGDRARRADDALQLRRVAPGLLSRLPGGIHDPLDDLRIGELDDHAVGDPAGDGERLRAVAGDPHRDLWQVLRPLELQLLAVPLDRPAVHQVLDHPAAGLELGDLHRLQAGDAPWWVWIGGILGAFYVLGSIVTAPKLGAATLVALILAGQAIASLLVDHYGWVGFEGHPITLVRVAGVVLLAGGVALVRLS